MGWCHEFGVVIHEGCSAPMVAGEASCSCPECGTTCPGRFASCADVWAAGPRLVAVRAPYAESRQRERAPATLVASLMGEEERPAPAEPAAVAEVLAWMVGAVDDLRSELQQVGETLAGQQEVVERLAGRDAVDQGLPARIADELAARGVGTGPAAVAGGVDSPAASRIAALAENLPARASPSRPPSRAGRRPTSTGSTG